MAYGTSLTKYGAWVNLLEQWFNEQFPGLVTIINSGGPGQNSDWGLAQVQTQVLDHHPDLVFIEFGANDAHARFKMPVERGKENLDKIVQAIQKQASRTALVLQPMNCFWDAPKGFTRADTDRSQLEAFYENYRALLDCRGVPHSVERAWMDARFNRLVRAQLFAMALGTCRRGIQCHRP